MRHEQRGRVRDRQIPHPQATRVPGGLPQRGLREVRQPEDATGSRQTRGAAQ